MKNSPKDGLAEVMPFGAREARPERSPERNPERTPEKIADRIAEREAQLAVRAEAREARIAARREAAAAGPDDQPVSAPVSVPVSGRDSDPAAPDQAIGPQAGGEGGGAPQADPQIDPLRPDPLPADPGAGAGADRRRRQADPRPATPGTRRRAALLARRRAALARVEPAHPAPLPESDEDPVEIADPSPEAQPKSEIREAGLRPRHYVLMVSFVLCVALPVIASALYLWTRAADQYHSEISFSIRSEEASSATAGLLGALTKLGSGSASDADILFEFIRGQKIVADIDKRLDLRRMFNREPSDVVFSLGEHSSIEDLRRYWNRMVKVSLDGSAGIVRVEVHAFTPEDARVIAEAILTESSALVNHLSEQARQDAIRFASDEFKEAEENLRATRQRVGDFRRDHRMVDPSADVAGQMGLLNALQSQLASTLVDRDVLLSYVGETDQRVIQANRRIDAITARIDEERDTLDVAGGAGGGVPLPDVVGAYEELQVDLEFANTTYTQTLAGLAGARAEARRQSRYLTPHIQPTLAETALYPRRTLITGLVALFATLGWGVMMLIYYNVRDNR